MPDITDIYEQQLDESYCEHEERIYCVDCGREIEDGERALELDDGWMCEDCMSNRYKVVCA